MPERSDTLIVGTGASRETTAVRVLLASNGQGEDAIGASLAAEIAARSPARVRLQAWPMVGDGTAYRAAGIEVLGPANRLPSEGFGTLSLSAFVRDLRAGWLAVHWRQWRAARNRRATQDLVLAVGDVVPLAAAWAMAAPFALIGCAKSAYYGGGSGYTPVERWLLRRALCCYPRDERTAAALRAAGIPVLSLGNPMMDGITVCQRPSSDAPIVACLPGSRSDRERNAAMILRFVAMESDRLASAGLRHFDFALPAAFSTATLERLLSAEPRPDRRWTRTANAPEESEPSTMTLGRGPLTATLRYDALARTLGAATVAIGLAGTANEQAVGAGVPVVTFATDGVQGDAYHRMKMPYFGQSAVRVRAESASLANALLRITSDRELHAQMVAAGRERMGSPGATVAIAMDVIRRWYDVHRSAARA